MPPFVFRFSFFVFLFPPPFRVKERGLGVERERERERERENKAGEGGEIKIGIEVGMIIFKTGRPGYEYAEGDGGGYGSTSIRDSFLRVV